MSASSDDRGNRSGGLGRHSPYSESGGRRCSSRLLLWHLYTVERRTFFAVAILSVAVTAVELLHFERGALEGEIERVESRV